MSSTVVSSVGTRSPLTPSESPAPRRSNITSLPRAARPRKTDAIGANSQAISMLEAKAEFTSTMSRGPPLTTWYARDTPSAVVAKRVSGMSTSTHHAIQVPAIRHALELVLARILEAEPGARHQPLDRVRDEDLRRRRDARDPGPDVDRDAARLAGDQLDLAGVDPRAHLDPQVGHRIADPNGATDPASRPVERREEPVTRGVDLGAPEAPEHGPHDAV